jgi:hypothetical protein
MRYILLFSLNYHRKYSIFYGMSTLIHKWRGEGVSNHKEVLPVVCNQQIDDTTVEQI